MSKYAIALALLVLPAARGLGQSAADTRWIAQCRDHDDGWRVAHCEVRVTTVASAGTIGIDPGENGGVTVEGWERDSVEVHARIQTHGATDDEAARVASEIRIVTSGGRIGVEGPSTTRKKDWGVSFVVYVPHRSNLKVDTYNGPIGVREVKGRMALTAYNGPVSLDGVGGDVHARTTNGPLGVELTGARWDGEGLDAETTNGPLDLAIPESYSARLEFGTVNGPFNLDFPLTVTILAQKGRRFTATLGAGGALVRVVTTNGPADIRRN